MVRNSPRTRRTPVSVEPLDCESYGADSSRDRLWMLLHSAFDMSMTRRIKAWSAGSLSLLMMAFAWPSQATSSAMSLATCISSSTPFCGTTWANTIFVTEHLTRMHLTTLPVVRADSSSCSSSAPFV